MPDAKFFKSIDDPRGSFDEIPYEAQWRIDLRQKLFKDRKGRSDLSQMPLAYGYEMHEGMFSRAHVPKAHWQHLLFAGPNCTLLTPAEHRPQPPDRVTCYWLAVATYGFEAVNAWIKSLPFKAALDMPWVGTHGLTVIWKIPRRWQVSAQWMVWYERCAEKLDNVAERS